MSEAPLPLDIARVLVVMPSWVGDTVMATPVLRALRRVRPGAQIIAVMRPGLDEILAGTPWIDDTVVAETKAFTAPARIARRVRAVAPGLGACMLLPNSLRSGLLGRLTGARRRIGYARSGRGLLLTHALDAPDRSKPIPAIEYYAELAAPP